MQTLDNRITSSDVGLMEHCKKLHKEVVSLQDQLYQTSQKLEAMTLKYQDKKIRQQEKIHSLRCVICGATVTAFSFECF